MMREFVIYLCADILCGRWKCTAKWDWQGELAH